MQRRTFIKNIGLGSASLLVLPSGMSTFGYTTGTDSVVEDTLAHGFISPPDSARPWVFWQWMNGQITRQGITLDLEAMQAMGIGGALCFNNAVGIPRGPVDYASPQWFELLRHAADECERLGLTLMLHNGAGYSGSGGPWITPEMSMQQLVWTEDQFQNTKKIKAVLPQPLTKDNFYQDIAVFAYPSLEVEKGTMKSHLKKMMLDGEPIAIPLLLDENPDSKIRFTGEPGRYSSLLLEFNQPFEARSITITRLAEIPHDLFDGPRDHPPVFVLEASNDGIHFQKIAQFNTPQLREMNTPAMQNFTATQAQFFRLKTEYPTWLSSLELLSAPRLAGWPGKTNWTHGNYGSDAPDQDPSLWLDPEKVLDISSFMDTTGYVHWKAPKKGNWTLVRMGHTTTGEEPAAHPDAGKGLEVDKFRKEALDLHHTQFLDHVITAMGSHSGKSFQGFTTDSWEAGKQNWSVVLPEEFNTRRGYAIGSWLLAMTGRILHSEDATERFLWDMNKTMTELLTDNYYRYNQAYCHQHGLQYHAEPYGDGNLDSLAAGAYLDIPMAEFWTRYIYGSDVTSKQAASVAHAYGKSIVGAEAFTGMPLTSKWTDYPYSLKSEGDYFYSLGINRFIFHVFVHQPYTTGFPGMTMGPFGTHFDRNNTWTTQAHGWITYLKRSQYLLQQGLSVVDVCYFKGDEPASGIPDIYQFLPEGYQGDVIGTDVLQSRLHIRNHRIMLPDGMQYRICMMAPVTGLLTTTLKKLMELVAAGMSLLVQSKPHHTFGLKGNQQEFQSLIEKFYGDLDGQTVTQISYGKGTIYWGQPLQKVLNMLGIAPDFSYSSEQPDALLHYTHKVLPQGDLYLISNHQRRPEPITAMFRDQEATPEIWNAETGEMGYATVYTTSKQGTTLGLTLAPSGALFIMFRTKTELPRFESISRNGQRILSALPFEHSLELLPYQAINTFSIDFWAKPDSYAHNGRSMVFHATDGVHLFGKKHAIVGMGIGQNGIKVYEQYATKTSVILEDSTPIEGWTYVALVYDQATPTLYINGRLAQKGTTSDYQVHPGLSLPPSSKNTNSYFEGNLSEVNFEKTAFAIGDIRMRFQLGLPEPQELPDCYMTPQQELIIINNGTYHMDGPVPKDFEITDCRIIPYNTDWLVSFPKHSGAPSSVHLDTLQSLRLHADFNVKHFSGTATYTKQILLNSKDYRAGYRYVLDLGRVEVIAQLYVNEQQVALLWKAPFAADITDYLGRGTNHLRIEITTLWANRLIGDEYLPVENQYSKDHYIEALPDWYVHNEPKPGERITFSTWHTYDRDSPLLESGLLGPVTLHQAVIKKIKPT